jgi:hypothetical protein
MDFTYYKIFCKDKKIKHCYIGSSSNIKQRMYLHKSRCNNEQSEFYNLKLYKFIRDNGGWDNFDYEIIEVNKNKLNVIIEQYFINEISNDLKLNTNNCYLSKKYIKDQKKFYYNKRKEEQKQKNEELKKNQQTQTE